MIGYPTQISLIPTTIALIRFIEKHGFASWYPYWYLGNPLHYLTGPILPIICLSLHKIFSGLNFFDILYVLIFSSFVLGPLGLFFFIRKLSDNWKLSAVCCLLFAVLPWHYFAGLVLGNGTFNLALMSLPWVLWICLVALEKWNRDWVTMASIAIAFVTLIDSLILLPLGAGLILLSLKPQKAQKLSESTEIRIARGLFLLILGWLLTFWWFSPGYWWTILRAPSLMGKGLINVIVWLGKILMNLVPVVLAILALTRFKKIKDRTLIFVLGWLGIFGFLTLMRFLSDPDFWQDWSSYGVELEMGLAIAIGLIIQDLSSKLYAIRYTLYAIIAFCLFIFWVYAWRWTPLLIPRKNIENTVEYRIGKQLSEIAKPPSASSGQAGETVFLSGTTAFWLNSFFDIPQVRGGRDEASVHPTWRQGVWEIREGKNAEDAEKMLKMLGVSYLVVHTEESGEYYHDFSYPEKFETAKSLRKVFSEKGDVIYRVEGATPEIDKEWYRDWTKPIGWGITLVAVVFLILFPKSWNLLSGKLPKIDLGREEDY